MRATEGVQAMNPYTSAIAIVAVLAAFGGTYMKGRHDVRAEVAAEVAEANDEARRFEQQRAARAGETIDAYIKARNVASASAGTARTELDRLRGALATQPAGDDACAAVRAAGARERLMVGECATALQAVAEDADRIQAKLTALQGWVTAVCVGPQ